MKQLLKSVRIQHGVHWGWFFTVWALLLSPAVFAKEQGAVSKALLEPVTMSVRHAPAAVFFKALLSNSSLTVTLDQAITQTFTGDYDGTIDSILKGVSKTHSLYFVFDDSMLHVSTQAPAVIAASNGNTRLPVRGKKQNSSPLFTDPIVERLFLLSHSNAADTALNDAANTVIPGAASQLKALVDHLGLPSLRFRGEDPSTSTDRSPTIAALSSMNAIMVQDRQSNMALYRDLIDSLDSPLARVTHLMDHPAAPDELTGIAVPRLAASNQAWRAVR